MSIAGQELRLARRVRDEARAALDRRVAAIRGDLDERGVGGRIADKLSIEAREALDEGLSVASESKGIIAGIAAALVLWFMRNPILGWIGDAFENVRDRQAWDEDDD